MALVTSKELLLDAQKNGYAVGAFNVENMEMVMAVLAAAEETKSPVIMQTTPARSNTLAWTTTWQMLRRQQTELLYRWSYISTTATALRWP